MVFSKHSAKKARPQAEAAGRALGVFALAVVTVCSPQVLGASPQSQPASQPAATSRPAAASQAVVGVGAAASNPASTTQPAQVTRQGPRRPERSQFGLHVATGVAIPFGSMLKFQSGGSGAELENGVGFSLRMALTLASFEIVWNMSILSTGAVNGRISQELRDAIADVVELAGGKGDDVQRDVTLDGPGKPLVTHHLAFGYRPSFHPIPEVSIAVPFGLGPVFVEAPRPDTTSFALGGAGLYMGLLAEYLYRGFLGLGGSVQGSVYVTEPDPQVLVSSFVTTAKLHGDRLAWLPMMTFSLHARVYY